MVVLVLSFLLSCLRSRPVLLLRFSRLRAQRKDRGAAGPIAFHASRRACRFYSRSLAFAGRRNPHGVEVVLVASMECSKIRNYTAHGGMRTVLPHAPVLVRVSARKARANGRGRGLSVSVEQPLTHALTVPSCPHGALTRLSMPSRCPHGLMPSRCSLWPTVGI